MRLRFFWLLICSFALQVSAQNVSENNTIQELPEWYWNSKMQAHTILLHTFFNCGLHHYDGNQDNKQDCPAGINCNDCFLSGIYTNYFNAINARIVTRTIKGGPDNPIWCTSIGEIYDGKDPISGAKNGPNIKALANSDSSYCDDYNIPKQLMEAAHYRDIKQLFYYRTSVDTYISENFPQWRAKNIDGSNISFAGSKFNYLCVNTPYSDVLNTRVEELISSGADALYFDNYHNPPAGCWCTYCTAKFADLMGTSMPAEANNPLIVAYYNKIIYNHISKIQKTIHDTKNGTQDTSFLVASAGKFMMLNKRDVNKNFVKLLDVPKSEYTHPLSLFSNKYFYSNLKNNTLINYRIPTNTRLGFAWSVLRDYSSHRTFSAWIQPEIELIPETEKFKIVPIPQNQLMSYLGAGYAFGFVIDPALYVNTKEDAARDANLIRGGVPNSEIIENYKKVFEIDNIIGPKIGNKKPVKWNAILFDADLKNDYLTNIETAPGVTYRDEVYDQKNLWKSYLLRCHAAFEAVKNFKYSSGFSTGSIKQPVYILDHDDFLSGKNMEGIANIIVPNKELLSDAIMSALESFNFKKSRNVFYLKEGEYYDKTITKLEQQQLLLRLHQSLLRQVKNKTPIYVKATDATADAVFAEFYEDFNSRQNSKYDYVVALTNNISWSVPLATRRIYAVNKSLDFSDNPDQISNLQLKVPQPIKSGSLCIRITPDICSELIDDKGKVVKENLQVFDLVSGESLAHSVDFDTQQNEFVIQVPSFDFISVIGIKVDGDCSSYAGLANVKN